MLCHLVCCYKAFLCYDLYGFDHAWKKSSLMRFIYSFHMPLFIFLSGLVSVTIIERKFFINDIVKRMHTLLAPFAIVGGDLFALYQWKLSIPF